jgi:hypothetical protein
VVEKFADSGQVELFYGHVPWKTAEMDEYRIRDGHGWVLKVFKKGTLLCHLQSQWPCGCLQWWWNMRTMENLVG